MSDDPLPPELAPLVAAERIAPVADAATRAAVRAKLAATVGHAALGGGAAAATGLALGSAGKILAVIALVGGGTFAAVTHRAQPELAPAVAAASVVSQPERATTPASFSTSPLPQPLMPSPSPSPSPSPFLSLSLSLSPRPPAPPPAPPPSELSLLHDAWLALSAHDAAHALALVDADPVDGPLAEERAALRVAALSALDRTSDARAAATAFLVRFPDSIHRARVERVLAPVTVTKDTP